MNPKTQAILARLSLADRKRLKRAAAEAHSLEYKWRELILRGMDRMTEQALEILARDGRLPDDFGSFEEFLAGHAFDVQKAAVERAARDLPQEVRQTRLAGPPKGNFPRNLHDLMTLWDSYRKRNKIPKRQRALAERIRREYLEKVREVWRQSAFDFREGNAESQEAVRERIRKAAKTTYGRAQMIVETETTYHYNHTRRAVYDQSSDVQGYLFLAIRDSATTRWCSTRTGLVYHREDPHLDEETPPVHWNCRSEILPLTGQNPRHRALLEDKSLDRRRHRCEPLPKEWRRG